MADVEQQVGKKHHVNQMWPRPLVDALKEAAGRDLTDMTALTTRAVLALLRKDYPDIVAEHLDQ